MKGINLSFHKVWLGHLGAALFYSNKMSRTGIVLKTYTTNLDKFNIKSLFRIYHANIQKRDQKRNLYYRNRT